MSALSYKIGFIGAGNMGEAMVGALIRADIFSPAMIMMSDVYQDRLEYMRKTYGVTVMSDNFRLFSESDIIVLAVKPQQMGQVLADIAGQKEYRISSRKRIISIAAGILIRKIEDALYPPLNDASRQNLPIIRVMPNTPALVLAAMSGMSANRHADAGDIRITRTILESMGQVVEFEEKQLDAVTGLSGSGPAYLFYLAEAMIAGGIAAGLTPQNAETLTLQTLYGAVKLLTERKEPPEVLRRKVTSPGGTTEAAIKLMETHGVGKHIAEAIVAAANRSEELSR
ncbi:MAG: pyrroline-5-carboxylate reductase [Desulfobacteraceae bacterium IS3]|nr:MAG: pyrroline-5-carboxylate reductase [Desulfobacteraceae bacterium IS3]